MEKVPGVYWRAGINKWVVSFRTRGTYVYLGCHESMEHANTLARKYREEHNMDKAPSNYYTDGNGVSLLRIHKRDGEAIECLVDTSDVPMLKMYNWHTSYSKQKKCYYVSSTWPGGIKIQRLLLGASYAEEVDHINGNTLDNRRENLRVTSKAQNMQNRQGANRNNLSCGVRGVTWDKQSKKWATQVNLNQRKHHLGRYDTVEEAEAAVKAWRRDNMPFSEMDKEAA